MHPSLRGIAIQAKRHRDYRFGNLYTMLNKALLMDSWRYLNKSAASGIDRVSAREYGKNLEANVEALVERLKKRSYRARLVMRHYIPKGGGKYRPLGIPVIEDKLLQTAVKRILEAIYESDFFKFSYGYRPGKGVKRVLKTLSRELKFGQYGYVVEADIKGFFDHIDHDWLMRMLKERVNDDSFLRLIGKWLKAGILEADGTVIHPGAGTPQGGSISPVLANIYLHYVLDLWFEKVVKPECDGRVYLCRYADDFICLFQYKRDADRFYVELPQRLAKFNLSLAAEKTCILRFTKWDMDSSARFDFVGFEFRWGKDRKGNPHILYRTSRKKLKQSLSNFTSWCKDNRHLRLTELFDKLNRKLRGYNQHYGIIGNYRSLREFWDKAMEILMKWLNRRSQRKSYNKHGFFELLKHFQVIRPQIMQVVSRQLSFNYCV